MKFSLFKTKPLRLTAIIVFTIFVCKFVFMPFRTHGISMEPTYLDRQFCFANRLSYLFSQPERGDIVVIRSNEKPTRYLLKRIIALPNETLEIKHGKVYIDGEYYAEPYLNLKNQQPWDLDKHQLDADHYYVIGDNRSMPVYAHVHLPVHRRNIIGKIFP